MRANKRNGTNGEARRYAALRESGNLRAPAKARLNQYL
jgi:hypothetical protein